MAVVAEDQLRLVSGQLLPAAARSVIPLTFGLVALPKPSSHKEADKLIPARLRSRSVSNAAIAPLMWLLWVAFGCVHCAD